MPKITGRIEVVANGKLLLNKSGATASGIGISGVQAFERKPVLGDTGLHGYTEEAVEAMVEVTVTDRDDIRLSDFAEIFENGTIVFRSARGGKSYTMNNATCYNNIGITGGEGETTLKFGGAFWTEAVQ